MQQDLLDKLTDPQLVEKFPAFREPQGSLPHSQDPVTFHIPELDQCSPHPPCYLFKIHLNIILPSVPRLRPCQRTR